MILWDIEGQSYSSVEDGELCPLLPPFQPKVPSSSMPTACLTDVLLSPVA